ncbi:hypothetical protein BD410DRAFT_115068 [Rickenella mellea]|uniref:Uncharacterized protein n=1 Tax=Rickenella mellea TaxID=50990 RepID=A0A4Y7Q9X2_9AGAM|nr:hypothetical protein BD410DRAFT_115068 [Rickenella mellea]
MATGADVPTAKKPEKTRSASVLAASEADFQMWLKGSNALVSSEYPENLPQAAKDVLQTERLPATFFSDIDQTLFSWIQKPLFDDASAQLSAEVFADITLGKALAPLMSVPESEILRRMLPNLMYACSRAKENARCPVLSNEATQLTPVDDIVKLAFLESECNSYAFGRETKLCMSRSTSTTKVDWLCIADTCIFSRLREFFVHAKITEEYLSISRPFQYQYGQIFISLSFHASISKGARESTS